MRYTKVWNVFGNVYNGAWDKSFVAVVSRGTNYFRAYAVPKNSETELQTEHRRRFAEASAAWKRLTPEERQAYNRAARRMSGYNLFIKRVLKQGEPTNHRMPERAEEDLPPEDGKQPEEL